eukprot:6884835-Lingulodinium_polyedra.AAC.1
MLRKVHCRWRYIGHREHQPLQPHLQRLALRIVQHKCRVDVARFTTHSPRIDPLVWYRTPSTKKPSGTALTGRALWTTGCSRYAGGIRAASWSNACSKLGWSRISAAMSSCGHRKARGSSSLDPSLFEY